MTRALADFLHARADGLWTAIFRTAEDDPQAALIDSLTDAEFAFALERGTLDKPRPRPRFQTPALDAWHRRGDTTTHDALWRAACWEQTALTHPDPLACLTRARQALLG